MAHKSELEEILEGKRPANELLEFREFMREIFSSESLAFWLEVEDYKTIRDPKEQQKRAQHIWNKYFTNDSPYEVNVSIEHKREVQRRIHVVKQVDTKTFDESQSSILQLMVLDSFPKFVASERYKRLRGDVFYKDAPVKKTEEKKIKRTPSFDLLEKHLKRISAPNTPKGSSQVKEQESDGEARAKEAGLVKEGFLHQLSRSSWKRRWFAVKEGSLYSYNSKKKISDIIPLRECQLRDFKPGRLEYCFQVISPIKTIVLKASNEQEMQEWLNVETGEINFNQLVPMSNVTSQMGNININPQHQVSNPQYPISPPKSPEKMNSSPNLPYGARPTYPLPPIPQKKAPEPPPRSQSLVNNRENLYGSGNPVPNPPIYNNVPVTNNQSVVNSNSNFYSTKLPPVHKSSRDPHISTEDYILSLFESKDSLPWDAFAKGLMNICKETSNKVAKLQPLLAPKTAAITKQSWMEFIKWFTPLVVVNDYQSLYGTEDTQEPANGYTLPEVVDIVAPRWFFLNIPKEKFREVLAEPGSYLFRFSSKGTGVYTLSAMNDAREIGHWRISSKKVDARVPPTFEMQGKKYSSLYEIVKVHSEQPLISVEEKTFKPVYLLKPADRSKHNFL